MTPKSGLLTALVAAVVAAVVTVATLTVLLPPAAQPPASTLDHWLPHIRTAAGESYPVRFAGDGALVWRDAITAATSSASIVEPLPPLAPVIGRLAARAADRGLAVSPHAIRPMS